MRVALVAGVSVLSAVLIVAAVSMLVLELRGYAVDEPVGQRSAGRGHGPSSGAGDGFGTATKETVRLAFLGTLWGRVVVAAVVTALAWWGTGWPVAAASCALGVLAWPVFVKGRRRERGEIAVLEAVVVWTQSLRDTVAGGASLEQAIGVSVDQAPSVLREPLEQVRSRMLVRHPLEVALTPLQELQGADFVVAALMLAARRRGDRLSDVLSGMVATSAQEVAQRRQVLAARAGIQRSVHIIMVVTVAILAWMATVGDAYMRPYDTLAGQVVLACVIALIAAGFVWLARLNSSAAGARFFVSGTAGASGRSAAENRAVAGLAQHPAAAPAAPSGVRAGARAFEGATGPMPLAGPAAARPPRAHGQDPGRGTTWR
ncbi:type II secretion system F family protein [Kineosporia sp. J2-2]|uniref:Type II secretion system F family protein n=1 Tax=Kineosporia corallincola TaxID=2835133 RepID=A0ABS5TTS9_9ACTN|nr:type II secretion system F family protein [Kineosporia corallincola]MBT0774208.1 type II secretion system F family protein [Kineosporia corallincola]